MRKLFGGVLALMGVTCCLLASGCSQGVPTSDEMQHSQQEKILQEGNSEVGLPAITDFFEKKQLKRIYELRDQSNLVTYTYLENEIPHVTPGKTALAGKLTFFGVTVGFGIPYATQYTNPQQVAAYTDSYGGNVVIPQADPNGLFSPGSAEGTWVLMKDPNGGDVKPLYVESRVVVSPFRLPSD